MSGKELTLRQVEDTVNLINKGMKYNDIANRLGISRSTVIRIAKSKGLTRTNRQYNKALILNDIDRGMSYKSIAIKHNVSSNVVSSIAISNNIRQRRERRH